MDSPFLASLRSSLSDRDIRVTPWAYRSRNVVELDAGSRLILLWFHESTLRNAWWGLSERLLTDLQRSGRDFRVLFVDYAENSVIVASAKDVATRVGQVWHLASSDRAYKVHRNHEVDGLRRYEGIDNIGKQLLDSVAPAA